VLPLSISILPTSRDTNDFISSKYGEISSPDPSNTKMTSATQSVDEAAIAFYVNVYLALNRMKRSNIAYTFVFMVTWSLTVIRV